MTRGQEPQIAEALKLAENPEQCHQQPVACTYAATSQQPGIWDGLKGGDQSRSVAAECLWGTERRISNRLEPILAASQVRLDQTVNQPWVNTTDLVISVDRIVDVPA